MKRKILIAGILALFSSCSIISGIAGVAGSVGPIIGATWGCNNNWKTFA